MSVCMQKPGIFRLFKISQELKRIFKIAGTFFQVLLSTIFYKTSSLFNETFLTWISLTYNIFSKKRWFLFTDKLHVQKSGDFRNCLFWAVKRKIQKQPGSQLEPYPPFQCYLSLSVWCVCFVYLHHFYQCYSCFKDRTQSYCI